MQLLYRNGHSSVPNLVVIMTLFVLLVPNTYAGSLGLSDAQIQKILRSPTRQSHTQANHHKSQKIIKIHKVTKSAKKMLQVPYRWGGSSPRGFDCSGLVQYSYKKVGVRLPRTAAEQYRVTRRVNRKHTAQGDLIFFHTRRSRKYVNHVGIYLGNNTFIHAPGKGKRVMISKLSKYWKRKMVGVGRTL